MKNATTGVLIAVSLHISLLCGAQPEPFSKRVVASGFNSAWEVLVGPNDSLWVTENSAYRVTRVNIANGVKTVLLNLKSGPGADPAINFTSGTQPQGGLMGMAIHPNLFSSNPAVRAAKPWVYLAYVYERNDCPGTNTHCIFTTKIVRYEYDGSSLTNPVVVLDNIPGSSDHNSGRLVISPAIETFGSNPLNHQYRLYYTVGDMGAGQFLNTTRTENALNIDVMEGKVLRINTEVDGDAGLDAWVPDNNPFYNASSITPRDYVFTYGHRNAQGLAWGVVAGDTLLYSCEQMDKSDDEINIIESGKNYGWDEVSGFSEGNYDCSFVGQYKIGQNNDIHENAYATSVTNDAEPIYTMFTASAAQMPTVNSQTNNNWPTIATSSIDFYGFNKIPNWNASLFVTGLKRDRVFRLKLNAAGTAVTDTSSYFRSDGNRIRRVRIDPSGLKFYVARDQSASINGGTIMEYSYTGIVLAINDNHVFPDIPENVVNVYPNPVTNSVYIHGKKEMRKPLRVRLYDLGGHLMKEELSFKNDFAVDISHFKTGVYILKSYNGYDIEVHTQKLIKH